MVTQDLIQAGVDLVLGTGVDLTGLEKQVPLEMALDLALQLARAWGIHTPHGESLKTSERYFAGAFLSEEDGRAYLGKEEA